MNREQVLTPPVTGRLWLLGALFLVTLPHILRMPPWLSISCLGVFLWRLLHETRGLDLPPRWLRLLLITGGIGAVILAYHTLIGRDPGVALLTVMLCLKLFELHRIRDAMIALFIGYFLVISGFLFSQSIFMGGYLFLVVLALTAALAALNHPDGRSKDNRFYLTFSGKLLVQSLPLMIVMFLLFPRLSGPLWRMPSDPHQARTGLSDSMALGTIANLVESEEVAFRVDFNGPIPPADQLYWRGPVLWHTDGRHWKPHRSKPSSTLPAYPAEGSSLGYTVTLEANNQHWLFAIDLPAEMPRGLNSPTYISPDFQLLTKSPINTKLRYSLRSNTNFRLSSLPPWMKIIATQLPQGTNPRTAALAQQWRDAGLTDEAVVQQALNYFSEQPFYYTRQPPLLGDQPVDQFLFNTRRGFCEHYAASFVTLMRSAAIPARVVTGYQGGERNAVGDYLIVRQANAHAWAEVWLHDHGWVRVDPTTMIPTARVETKADTSRFRSIEPVITIGENHFLTETFQQFRYRWDALNHAWNHWILGFDREAQEKLLRKLGLTDLSWPRLISLMVAFIIIVLSLLGLNLLRRPVRPRDPVLRLYQQFCDKMRKAGITRQPDEGPTDFAHRIALLRPDLSPDATLICEHYIRLRYMPNPSEQHLDDLRKRIRAFAI